MTENFTQRGFFMARQDGVIQFPVGNVIVSLGFNDQLHYGPRDGDHVEFAAIEQMGNGERGRFITRDVIKNVLGIEIRDEVAVIDRQQLNKILAFLATTGE